MFKRIRIELAGPICTCEDLHLSWGITADNGIFIECTVCKVVLRIPRAKFVGQFELEKPYPAEEKKRKIRSLN